MEIIDVSIDMTPLYIGFIGLILGVVSILGIFSTSHKRMRNVSIIGLSLACIMGFLSTAIIGFTPIIQEEIVIQNIDTLDTSIYSVVEKRNNTYVVRRLLNQYTDRQLFHLNRKTK